MKNNPYIGPRPFERADRINFFGRTREARDLLALIMAERVVLFYAQSGAGKTSLLNTQIIPALEDEGFYVLPVVRVGSELPPGLPDAAVKNIFAFSVWMALMGQDTPLATMTGNNLLTAIKTQWAQAARDEFDEPRPPILIVDQFEEILTTHRNRWQDAQGFFEQLAEALEKIPKLGIVLAMREDFVAGLDPYAPLFSKRLKARFRMERLGYAGALEAIKKPAASALVPFEDGVAEQLADELRRIKTVQFGGREGETVLGPYVEPVQLQVVCSQLWANLPEQADREIDQEDVQQYGNVDQALISFYEGCVQRTAVEVRLPERMLRRWFVEKLITPMQTRGLVLRGEKDTAGLINVAVDHFESAHLISSDVRAGARWYEISHDRLVDPILHSNRAWEQARQTPLRLTAQQWKQTGQDGLLFIGPALRDAEAWIAAHPDEAEPDEIEFVQAGQQLERSRRRRRLLNIAGFAVAAIVIGVVSVLGIVAYRQSRLSSSLSSFALAMLANSLQYSNQEQAIILSRMALDADHTAGSEIALRQAILDYYPAETLRDVADVVYTVIYSPDGTQILAGLVNGEARVWDAQTRRLIRTFPVGVGTAPNQSDQRGIWGAAYRSDGQQLAFTVGNSVEIWNIDGTPVITLTGHTGPVYSVAYSSDGKWLASGGGDANTLIWNTQTWQPISLTNHLRTVRSVAFSPDGKWLGSGSWDKTITLHPITLTASGTLSIGLPITLTGHTANVNAIAFSPDSKSIASASDDRTARVWDVKTGLEKLTLTGHTDTVRTVAYSADGQSLLTAGSDAVALIWDVGRGNNQYTRYLTGPTSVINGAALSPDGHWVMAGSGDGTVWVWDREPAASGSYTVLNRHTGGVRRLVYKPDGTALASASSDGTVRVWAGDTGEPIMTLPKVGGALWSAAYSPDGKLIATVGADSFTRIWDVSNSQPVTPAITLQGHGKDQVGAVAFSPDGRYLATGGWDDNAVIWDTQTWQPVHKLEGHLDDINAVAFSPDSRVLATGSSDDTIKLWDVVTGNLIKTLAGHTSDVFGLAFSPDGQQLASGSWDNTIRLWDMRTYTTTEVLEGHSSYVYDVAYSADGKYLVSGSRDQSVRLWDLTAAPPETIGILYGHTGLVRAVAYRPDGKVFASGSADTTIRRYPALYDDVLRISKEYVPRELTPEEERSLLGR
jgi:WD40 repeat protein